MEQTIRNDLSISGSGSAPGGMYEDVKVNGSGTIQGDLDCILFKSNGSAKVIGQVIAREVKINGSAKIQGSVTADEVTIMGSGTIEKSLACQELSINGSATVAGSAEAKECEVNGSATFKSDLTGDDISIRGRASIEGNCSAEHFYAKGQFKIEGLLNAESVEVDLYGECNAKEIGGMSVKVKNTEFASPWKKILRKLFPSSDDRLTSDLIEGDHIVLENTSAKIVRGDTVVIGKGCDIQLVEYKSSLDVRSGSSVAEEKKI
ncbi:polymer-forming cytoskeletal protein [Fictibacillus iocasae]|uniref:Polymer-forming cytoskeletal protein n=1 Tax=Fictibacillus iocasae TaxID=2715437 RepID=A0ABW2NQX7_9BACL